MLTRIVLGIAAAAVVGVAFFVGRYTAKQPDADRVVEKSVAQAKDAARQAGQKAQAAVRGIAQAVEERTRPSTGAATVPLAPAAGSKAPAAPAAQVKPAAPAAPAAPPPVRAMSAGKASTSPGASAPAADNSVQSAHRVHCVKRGETLFQLARIYYGDGSTWRLIAEANGIKDERQVQVGDRLIIPLEFK